MSVMIKNVADADKAESEQQKTLNKKFKKVLDKRQSL
jgi:hypothetical protein